MSARSITVPVRHHRNEQYADLDGPWIQQPTDLFAKLPLELRLHIFDFFFVMMDFAIHPSGDECNTYCGKLPRYLQNMSLLFVNKQTYAEAKLSFLKQSTFHLHRIAYHGRQTMSEMPVGNAAHIRDVTIWGDVAYRVATDMKWYNKFCLAFRSLRVVKLNLEWTDQQTRMAPEFSNFIHKTHKFTWQAEIRKKGRHNVLWKICIDNHLQLRVSRERGYDEYKIMNFLAKINLGAGHIAGPIRVFPLKIRFVNPQR